jgi:hypothetical protein
MAPEIQNRCPSPTAVLLLLGACLAAVAALGAADYDARASSPPPVPLPVDGGARRVLVANGLGLTPQMG